GFLVAQVASCDFAGHKNLFTRDAAGSNALANFRLVAIGSGGIDSAIARIQRPCDSVLSLRPHLRAEYTEAEAWHFNAIVQREGAAQCQCHVCLPPALGFEGKPILPQAFRAKWILLGIQNSCEIMQFQPTIA